MYEAEIKFLNKKLTGHVIKWEVRSAVEQVMTPLLSNDTANQILADLKRTLAAKAGMLMDKMAFVVQVKGQARVVVSIKLLREKFAGEIDAGGGGGGGPGLNPLKTSPSPMRF